MYFIIPDKLGRDFQPNFLVIHFVRQLFVNTALILMFDMDGTGEKKFDD